MEHLLSSLEYPVPRPELGRHLAIVLGARDARRLRRVVRQHLRGPHRAAAEQLETELERAVVVPQHLVPPDIVTVNTALVVADVERGTVREVAVVYPEQADPRRGRISVLTPVGTALLGLAEEECIEWPMPDGRSALLRVESVLYQPEAAGDRDP
jgi:regulator of nucleoside diphosphate kinase